MPQNEYFWYRSKSRTRNHLHMPLESQPMLEGTSQNHLVQPFLGKGALMRSSSTLSNYILKTSSKLMGTLPHLCGGFCSDWLFSP